MGSPVGVKNRNTALETDGENPLTLLACLRAEQGEEQIQSRCGVAQLSGMFEHTCSQPLMVASASSLKKHLVVTKGILSTREWKKADFIELEVSMGF